DLRSTIGDFVDVDAGFDASTRTATWALTAIDPATGQLDARPTAGFLPPDDATGRGEGYVSFSASPPPGSTTGTVVSEAASIVFDRNAALPTGMWTNTLDATPPTATVASLGGSTVVPFPVAWSGTDDGSGVATFDVYSATDGGPFTPWLLATTATGG